ncbi:MAG: hypothetical protein LBS69_06135 [Prevotellaceae bacterium]|jgi:hypothetical protein|nr:hypothetical protein [Prevotellaceae bacterium]
MNKKFSMNDLNIIKKNEMLTNNQLDLIKGGVNAGATDCNCGEANHNRDGGKCECTRGGNTNAKKPSTLGQEE